MHVENFLLDGLRGQRVWLIIRDDDDDGHVYGRRNFDCSNRIGLSDQEGATEG